MALPDGRILSWSDDKTLRIWDRDGNPLAVLNGHAARVLKAFVLPDRGILSFSWGDKTFRLWDRDGKPLEVYGLDEGFQLFQSYPEVKRAFNGPRFPNRVYGNAYLTDKDNSAILAGDHRPAIIWHGASRCTARLLQADGRAEVTQANGQVCVLQFYHGNRPISLDELEAHATAEAGSHPTAEPPGQKTPEAAI